MNSTPADLDRVTACGWSLIGMPRRELAALRDSVSGSHGHSALLASCQRFEAYGLARCRCGSPDRWRGPDAVNHLAEVAAGLHSVVLGERQVLGQARAAFRDAGGPLAPFAAVAIASARDLRARHRFDSHAGHLLDRALQLAGEPAAGTLLVLGAGELGRLVARRGRELGFERVYLAGRIAPPPAGGLWEFLRWDRLQLTPRIDVLAGCLGSSAASFEAGALPPVSRLVVDLGTPPNFAGRFDAPLLGLADLMSEEESRPPARLRRQALVDEVREIVARRLGSLTDETERAIARMRAATEAIRRREAARAARLHVDVDPAVIETLSRALVNQMLHAPTDRLRREGSPERASWVAGLFEESDQGLQ